MNKTQILAALAVAYPMSVDVPGGNPSLVETVGLAKKYLYYHLQTGVDQNKDPVAHKTFKVFYVWNEDGGASEFAYYEDSTATNGVTKNIVAANPSSPTAIEIYNLYNSSYVRQRVIGLMVRAANDIYNEDVGTTSHTQRMKWTMNVMQDVNLYVNVMMAFVSMNALILGGAWVDEDLRYIVNSNITAWAVTLYS